MADFNHDDPHSEGDEGEGQDDWDKVASNTVCYPLDGSLVGGREERGEGEGGRRGGKERGKEGRGGRREAEEKLSSYEHTQTPHTHWSSNKV